MSADGRAMEWLLYYPPVATSDVRIADQIASLDHCGDGSAPRAVDVAFRAHS